MTKVNKIKIIIFLLILSPVLGELVPGASPPSVFFKPIGLLIMVLLYGCGTLLIREAMTRWKMKWSVLFLAIAYGIVEEGLAVKSFFNPGWMGLGPISGYGMFFGIQWVWTLMLIGYHATISTMIPIAISALLWPNYKDVPLLKKKGMFLALLGFISSILFSMVTFGNIVEGKMVPFFPPPIFLIGSLILVLFLVWLGYKYRNSHIRTNKTPLFYPFIFGAIGFMYQFFYLFLFYLFLPRVASGITTIFLLIMEMILVLLFIFYQIYHQNITKYHITSLIFGSILFWILISPISEFSNGKSGMVAVGIISLILLILWGHIVLKRKDVYNEFI